MASCVRACIIGGKLARAETGRCIGRERESVRVPELSVDCQKRETFLVVSHLPSSSFPTQLFKNGRREKGQDSSGVHEFVSLLPRCRSPPHSLSQLTSSWAVSQLYASFSTSL